MIFLLDFGTVPTVWYLLEQFQNLINKNTTLLEQFQNLINKNTTVGTVPKSNKQKYHTVGTVPKSKRKIIETKTKIDTSNTHIQDRSLSLIPLTHIYKTLNHYTAFTFVLYQA
jgi:hypothetical protein